MSDLIDEKTQVEKMARIAYLANLSVYDSEATRKYIDGAVHIKHPSLRTLYAKLAIEIYDFATQHTLSPKVLDLGAGEGSATLPFLELGAFVTAVDSSQSQLEALQIRCQRFAERLEVRCEDIGETLKAREKMYDVIIASSFLHHIPDYLALINEAILLLVPHGQFFSFQDPLRYDSVGSFSKVVGNLGYLSWRIFRKDVVGGFRRSIRRMRGIYLSDSIYDNAEYHVTRNGVDQDAIWRLLKEENFDCAVMRYFSTQSRAFQIIGASLGVENTFAVIARKQA